MYEVYGTSSGRRVYMDDPTAYHQRTSFTSARKYTVLTDKILQTKNNQIIYVDAYLTRKQIELENGKF